MAATKRTLSSYCMAPAIRYVGISVSWSYVIEKRDSSTFYRSVWL